MILNEKEQAAIKDLQTQEQSCIEKYDRFSNEANDPVLKELFASLKQEEQKHYDSLQQVLEGTVPTCDCNDYNGKMYSPVATYGAGVDSSEKAQDNFFATDCIGTEKLVSGEYNTDVFVFADSDVRKLLADIQIEEQNHAEMLYKYKVANDMA